jgi:sigma-B regulation protein RsbU (phosphoserine phosphatase)
MDERIELDKLRSAVKELSVLNDIASAVSSARELDQVIGLIVHECVKHLNVEQGAVMLLDDKKSSDSFRTMVRKVDTVDQVVPYHFGLQLSGWMIKNQSPLMIKDFQSDTRFKVTAREKFPIKSLLSVPLKLKGNLMGVLNVFNKKGDIGFSPEDQRLLSIIATQSAQLIENARLYEEEQALQHIEEELRVARGIQANLLPTSVPNFGGFDIAGRSLSAKEVGGDYFDFISITENRLAVCVGDISGKGMPAALLMANLQATLRGQTHIGITAKDCVERSNKLLFQSTDTQKFATLFYGIIDCEENSFNYSNAGHNPPFLFTGKKKPIHLHTGGTVLGFMNESQYEEGTISLKTDDVIVIYSDGITEAFNEKEDEFGPARLEKSILKNISKSAGDILQAVLNDVKAFTGETTQSDDITIVVIKCNVRD